MGEAVILLIIFGFVFASIYIFLSIRNKERMAMIEKGTNLELFKRGTNPEFYKSKLKVSNLLSIKFGFFFIGIAFGVLFGNVLDLYTGLEEGTGYVSGIFLFGGLGLIAGYFFQAKKEDK